MDRIKQLTPATISNVWYADGTIIDPGTVTVGITRWDGTVLVAPGTATGGSGAAARTFSLTTAHTALLDRLTVTWTTSLQGVDTSMVEVVGDFLFSIAEFKALPGQASASTADVVAKRLRAEQALERRLSVAFVPRYTRESITGQGTAHLSLKWPKTRTVRSASAIYAGTTTTLSASDLTNLSWDQYGNLYGYTWTYGYPWTVGYEHGWDAPEEPIRDAALALAYHYMTQGTGQEGVDARVDYITTPEGRINYGIDGLGLPAVDRAIADYDMSVGVA